MLDLNQNQLYKEVIMEHTKHPRNVGLHDNLKTYNMKNPLCGDNVSVQIELNNGVIANIYAKSIGCSISTSSTSIMSEVLQGKTVGDAIVLVENFVKMVKGEPYNKQLDLKDAVVYEGVVNYPARFKCATISWELVLNALHELNK